MWSADVTCKTNAENRPLFKVQGIDGEGKIFTRMNVLLWDESREAFDWAFATAIPSILGDSASAGSVIISDGDGQEIIAIDDAIRSGIFPNATRLRCFWHLVHQALARIFGLGQYDSDQMQVVRLWLNELAYNVETEEEFEISYTKLQQWIEVNMDTGALMPRKKGTHVAVSRMEALRTFVRDVASLGDFWVKYKRMGVCTLGQITTAISEAANAAIKRGNMSVHKQMQSMSPSIQLTRLRVFQPKIQHALQITA